MDNWNPRANEIFVRALEIESPAKRADFLDESCGDDRELRRAVEALIKSHENVGSFLDSPAIGLDVHGPAESADEKNIGNHDSNANDATLPPKREPLESQPSSSMSAEIDAESLPHVGAKVSYFGDYELVEEIARGGMGVVYKARQTSLNRIVALKMILAGQLASEDDVQRFHAEAEAAANLDHPGIVPIYEVGEHQGQHYFSMGLVDGASLAEQIKDGPLPAREAAQYTKKIAEAVAFAHERGVIHRDLKPANVLLDQNKEPKVTDFGLAKRVDRDSGLTATGQILGTPSYMPPEQASGNSDEITETADVFSLGAILYALVTGRPPFQAASHMDTLLQVRACEPISPRVVNPDVPQDLDTICLKCLEKQQQRRYASAQELVSELDRYLLGEPIHARPISRWERATKLAKRRPSAAALVIVCVLGVTGVLTQWYRAESSLERLNAKNYLDQIRLVDSALAAGDFARADLLLNTCPHHLREWEWHYLRKKSHETLTTVTRRDGNLNVELDADFSPDGRKFAALEISDWISIWDAIDGRALVSLYAPGGEDGRVRFLSDGKRVAVANYDRPRNGTRPTKVYYRTYDASTGIRLHTTQIEARIPPGYGRWVGICPDGTKFATVVHQADETVHVKVWDAGTGRELLRLPIAELKSGEFYAELNSRLEYSKDGKQLLLKSPTRAIVWGAENGHELLNVAVPAGNDYALSSDRSRLVTSSQGMNVRILATGKELFTIPGPMPNIMSMSPEDQHIAVARQDGSVAIVDGSTGRGLTTYRDYVAGSPIRLTFSGDSKHLASLKFDETIRIWHLAQDQATPVRRHHSGPVCCLAFSGDGRRFASSDGHTLTTWDSKSGKSILELSGHTDPVTRIAFDDEDQRLVASIGDESLIAWDLGTGRQVSTSDDDSRLVSLAVSSDGQLTAEKDRQGRELKISDGKSERYTLTPPPRSDPSIHSVAFSQDNEWVAVGGDYAVNVWRLRNAHRHWINRDDPSLQAHTGPVRSVAYTRDGKRLASASDDGTIRIWDTTSWQEVLTLKSHSGPVHCIAFSPDEQMLLSGGDDGIVRSWHAPTEGAQAAALPWSYFRPRFSGNDVLEPFVGEVRFYPLLALLFFLIFVLPSVAARWALRQRKYSWPSVLLLTAYLTMVHAGILIPNLPQNINLGDALRELVVRVYWPSVVWGLPIFAYCVIALSWTRKKYWNRLAWIIIPSVVVAFLFPYSGGPSEGAWLLPIVLFGELGVLWAIARSVLRCFQRLRRLAVPA